MKAQLEIPIEILDSIKDEVYEMVMDSLRGTNVGDQIFSMQEAADFLGVSRSTLQEVVKNNPDFPTHQFGRRRKIVKSELIEWLKGKDYVFVTNFQGC